jgi:hypothetical protein
MREPSALIAAVALLLAFAVAAFAPQIFNDGDTWWHLAAGRWILTHRAVPTHDVFSFTFAGTPWNAQEWLAEVLMAGAFALMGWSGLHLLFGLTFGVTAALLASALRQRMDTLPALLTALVGLACISGSLLARPHVLALPLLALWTTGLVAARERCTAPPLWLVLVMLAWANLHGSFAFGLALAAALGMEAVLENRAAAKPWLIFLCASVIVVLINPQGLNGLLFPIRLLLLPGVEYIGEWAPADLTHPSPFIASLLAMVYVLATGKVRLPPIRALLILGLVYLGLTHVRHQMLFGVTAPLLAAPSLGKVWPPRPREFPIWPASTAFALVALLAIVRPILADMRFEDPVTPVAALMHVPRDLRAKPVLNAYAYGGYLIFSGVKVFVDSRADVYPPGFFAAYSRLEAGDRATLTDALARWRIGWTMFPSNSPTARLLDQMPGWRRLYANTNAVVHVRDQGLRQ